MDPFSHILLAYLLGFGIFGAQGLQFVVASAFAGALPDADVLVYPLSSRFPMLRHRGISHSIVGVTGIAAVGSFVVPRMLAWAFGPGFGDGSAIYFFVALEVGGLSHVLLDAMDHWSVPIFAPFSKHEYHFDADRIMNFGAMSFTVFAYGVMLYERGRVGVWLWELTTYLLLLAAGAYFAVRLVARWRAGTATKRLGFDDVIPQGNPLVFLLHSRSESAGELRVRFARYHLIRGIHGAVQSVVVPPSTEESAVISSPELALSRSYPLALRASWILGETHHFGIARAVRGGFEVFWFSLEMASFGRSAGVLARVDSGSGAITTRTAWRNPTRVFEVPSGI
ncbi:MAG: metal-dependent hydrolase [Thermoplasmata archaeon]